MIDASCVLADLIYTFLSPGCTPPEGPDAPQWLEVLARISLAITTVFLIEIPLSTYAFGLQFYNPFGPVPHSVLHLFDAMIIVITFALEVFLKGREQELASLLIIFRLWRLIKLVGGQRPWLLYRRYRLSNILHHRSCCWRWRGGGRKYQRTKPN